MADIQQHLEKMRLDWDERARENARHYVVTGQTEWSDEEFFGSGEATLANEILTDLNNICQGIPPGKMRVLEIGCGAGRVTRAFARFFGEVHAVDVSGEMVRAAGNALTSEANVFVYQNNGRDLSVLPPLTFDFAFSCYVFQHISSRDVIENYMQEVHRLLRPGALFKFQLQGNPTCEPETPGDTWLGVPYTEEEVLEMARRSVFEARYRHGAGTQLFWLWFFKK